MATPCAAGGDRAGAAYVVAFQRPVVVGADAGAARPALPLTSAMDLTTVADDLVVFHDGIQVDRFDDLAPDTEYVLCGV